MKNPGDNRNIEIINIFEIWNYFDLNY